MEAPRAEAEGRDSRFEGLHAEASAAVGQGANTLRAVRERYRETYAEALARWSDLRDELETLDNAPRDRRPRLVGAGDTAGAAEASEASAQDGHVHALRTEVELLRGDLAENQSTLEKLDLAEQTLSRTWLFLEHGDASLIAGPNAGVSDLDVAMRIVEAQEAERTRIAREIHDGPAQAFSNAIFQADYIERVIETDQAAAIKEIHRLREDLRRDLAGIRDLIYQLRPAMLDEAGLDQAIEDTIDHLRARTDLTIASDLRAPGQLLDEPMRTVMLRVTQEALQNIRKHARATTVLVRTSLEGDDWTLEIRDDGRGFDVGEATSRGRRNFGLPFMQGRAELIGARFHVGSSPDGTVVRVTIPLSARTGAEESR
jgi:two-component system sensor histidine kinase DegS